MFIATIDTLRVELADYNLQLGQTVTTDATPLPARKSDKESMYTTHYKWRCYKLHRLLCTTTNIPIAIRGTKGNVYDGDYLLELLFKARDAGITFLEVIGDDQYGSFENHALVSAFGAFPRFYLRKNAVYHETAEWISLYGRVKSEERCVELTCWEAAQVGKALRNGNLREYEEHPEGWLEAYHQRSTAEGGFGHEKDWIGLENLPKGYEKVLWHIALVELTMVIVALTKVQNGVLENLTGIAGLISG